MKSFRPISSFSLLRYSTIPICLLSAVFLFFAGAVRADDHLLYFEAQAVGGYSSDLHKGILYSMNPEAEMQKPSVGFDYIQRFSGESGDIATFALQGRLALKVDAENGNTKTLEPQIYNAYLKSKILGPYLWIGHNRPAFGLGSYFDSHGLLLRTLPIEGVGGYDRDWGAGMNKDFSWGDVSASLTTGSGMPIAFKGGNYMAAARGSYWVLSRDNMNLGVSLGYGKTLDTMGYEMRDSEPRGMRLAGLDFTLLRNNLEHRVDLLGGKWLGENTYAFAYRFGISLDPESRFKLEAQPTYWKVGDEQTFELGLCASMLATSDLTIRLGYFYDHTRRENIGTENDNKILLQLYYYTPVQWLNKLLGKKA
jgi:hypothetical protein